MKKPPRQPNTIPPEFKAAPFKALKSISKNELTKRIGEQPSSTQKAVQPEDDDALFLKAVAGTKKLFASEEVQLSCGSQKREDPDSEAQQRDAERLFLDAVSGLGRSTKSQRIFSHEDDSDSARSSQRSSSRMRQLKRGTLRIAQQLDLHGFQREAAIAQLDRFIVNAWARGMESVLVITGKGMNSPEGPVLRGEVEGWLRGRGNQMVSEFCAAPRDKGGDGAFVVFLRRRIRRA